MDVVTTLLSNIRTNLDFHGQENGIFYDNKLWDDLDGVFGIELCNQAV